MQIVIQALLACYGSLSLLQSYCFHEKRGGHSGRMEKLETGNGNGRRKRTTENGRGLALKSPKTKPNPRP